MYDFRPRKSRPEDSQRMDHALAGLIIRAIRRNDKSKLLHLLKKPKRHPLPLPTDKQGRTILHKAASEPEYKDSLELLLKYKDNILLDIDAKMFDGYNALHIACICNCEERVELLLRYGCDPCQKGRGSCSALWVAVTNNNLQMVKYLLNYIENLDHSQFVVWAIPLHYAAMCGYLEITRTLLDKGADILSKDQDGNLPFHLACRYYHFDVVRLLFESNSTTINCQNSAGITPLSSVVRNCEEQNFDVEVLRFLLENGAKVDICDKDIKIALHFAASSGNVEFLQLLLQFTDVSNIEKCLSSIPNILNEKHEIFSITCDAIRSKNIRCLEILLSSKISKSILERPFLQRTYDYGQLQLYSPLAYVCENISDDELLMSFLQLLLKHKITMLDDFLKKFQIDWPQAQGQLKVEHPFSSFFDFEKPFMRPELLDFLHSNDINIDYCLRCYCLDKSRDFCAFSGYKHYYEPLRRVILQNNMKILKLFMSTSVILEPDLVSVQFYPISRLWFSGIIRQEMDKYREVFQYLISLKPVYFTHTKLRGCNDLSDLPRFPYATLEEEFSASRLQQLCRTVIRHHIRERTIGENLRNFKRKIMELPLPPPLKDYLLFKE